MTNRPPLKDRNSKTGLIGLGPIPGKAPVASFNISGINNLLETKSFDAIHYSGAYFPEQDYMGMPVDPNTQGAKRGLIYYSARKLGVIPQQFKIEDRLNAQGIWGIGSVLMNVTGHYFDGDKEQVHISHRDLIVIPTLTDKMKEKVPYHVTGVLKLKYRCLGVDYLTDGVTSFQQGFDFDVDNGMVQWRDNGRKPVIELGKPPILSIVYWHTPIYVVQNMLHSLRMVPSNEIGHGGSPRDATYVSQQFVAKPSNISEEADLLDWLALPDYSEYPDSNNSTGGT
jgi:hypothetical protein